MMKVYYHKHWSESSKGGAYMLHTEEYVYSSENLSDSRELQDPDQPNSSGWDCHSYDLKWEGVPEVFRPGDIPGFDDDIPFGPVSQRDKLAWEIEGTSVGEVSAAEVLAMTSPDDWGFNEAGEWWVEYSPSVPGELEDNPALVFCRLSHEPGCVSARDYRHISPVY